MTKEIQNFITYMCEVKQISKNTELSYERDLRKMSVFLQEQGVVCSLDTGWDMSRKKFPMCVRKEKLENQVLVFYERLV